MIALPDFALIGFIEWLRHRLKNEKIFMNALFLDEDLWPLAKRYACDYLYEFNNIQSYRKTLLKELLLKFIESDEFNQFIYEISNNQIPKVINYDIFNGCAFQFYRRCVSENEYYCGDFRDIENINPEQLVQSVYYYLCNKNSRKEDLIQCMMNTNIGTTLVIDFLNWLYCDKRAVNINKMPTSLFKKLAKEYSLARCKGNQKKTIDDLVCAFKGHTKFSLIHVLKKFISPDLIDEYKKLGYVYERYNNISIRFKCIILPIKNETHFEKFIRDYWEDLNESSGDLLDIYYSISDLDQTGFTARNKLFLNIPQNKLPCIVLWEKEVSDAVYIDISGLAHSEIHKVMQTIIAHINNKISINELLKEASNMVKEINEKKERGKIVINQTISGSKNVVTGVNEGNITTSFNTDSGILEDLQAAIEEIKSMGDIDGQKKKYIIQLLKETQGSIENEDEEKIKLCKSSFNAFMIGAGSSLIKVLTFLGTIASIAAFFNITVK